MRPNIPLRSLFPLLLTAISADVKSDGQQHPMIDQGAGDPNTIIRDLRHLLSDAASVVLPSSPAGHKLQDRASSPRVSPEYVAIVEVATEEDVVQTVSGRLTRLPFAVKPAQCDRSFHQGLSPLLTLLRLNMPIGAKDRFWPSQVATAGQAH